MIQKHSQVTVPATGNIAGPTITGLTVNGLIFACAAAADLTKTFVTGVFRPTGDPSVQHANRIAMSDLAMIADLFGGMAADDAGKYIRLPLGNVNIGADALELSFDNTDAAGRTIDTFSYRMEDSVDFQLVYEKTNILDAVADDVEAAFLFHNGKTLTVQVTADGVSTLTDVLGLKAANAVLFEAEKASAVANLVCMFVNRDSIPDELAWRVTGDDVAGVYVIVIKRIYGNRVSKQTLEAGNKLGLKLAKIEAKRPDKARALRHAGITPKSGDVLQAVQQKRAMNASKGIK